MCMILYSNKNECPYSHSFPVPYVASISSTSLCWQCWYDIWFISSLSLLFPLCQRHQHYDVDDVDTCTSSSSFSFPFCRHCRHCNFESVDAIASLSRDRQSYLSIFLTSQCRQCWSNIVLHRHCCYYFPFIKFVDILFFSVWIRPHHWGNCWHRYVEQYSFNDENKVEISFIPRLPKNILFHGSLKLIQQFWRRKCIIAFLL